MTIMSQKMAGGKRKGKNEKQNQRVKRIKSGKRRKRMIVEM